MVLLESDFVGLQFFLLYFSGKGENNYTVKIKFNTVANIISKKKCCSFVCFESRRKRQTRNMNASQYLVSSYRILDISRSVNGGSIYPPVEMTHF